MSSLPAYSATPGALPIHRQVSEALVRDIRAGKLKDGTCLKPERMMAKELGVSVGTLRKALSHLEALNLLKRVQGSGNYISYSGREAGIHNIYSLFRLELLTGGGLPTAEVMSAGRVEKPDFLSGLGTAKWAFQIKRLRRLNGLPSTIEEIWLDGDRARGLRASQLSEALYQLYETKLGFTISHVEDRIGVSTPPPWQPKDFGPWQAQWSCVERWSYDTQGKAVEFSQNWYNPETTTYVARWAAAENGGSGKTNQNGKDEGTARNTEGTENTENTENTEGDTPC